ncbi:DUF1127 domain-containing protein [Yoonia sp.]|uniref:DUF1127 domain-containing protein n=1 Tax=Yoonia sp. TaxID=2212373 RepID=UPI0035C7B4AA
MKHEFLSSQMTVQTATHAALPDFAARLGSLRTKIAEAAAKRKVYRTTLTELESLSPRDLADLGIARTSIHEIAYEAAYGA